MSDATTFVLLPPPPPAVARRRTSRVVLALVAALAVLAGAAAFLVRGGGRAEAVPLALSFTVGERTTYAISQTMDAELSADGFGELGGLGTMPLVMELSQTVTWETLAVDAEGVATISITTEGARGSVNGIEVPASDLASPPVEMQVAPDGRILSIGGLSVAGLDQGGLPGQTGGLPGMNQLTPILPEDGRPVAPGDSWETSFSQEVPFGEGTIAYDVRSTYLRNEDVGGVEAAVIRSEVAVPLDVVFRMSDLAAFLEEQGGAPPANDLGELADASLGYEGTLDFEMTSSVDLDASELLRSDSAGDFDLSIAFEGVPGFEGSMVLAGSFTQALERR